MKPQDLDTLRTLFGKLSQRYGQEPLEHLKPQPGSTGAAPGAAPEGTRAEGLDVIASAIGTLALADAIHHLAEVIDKPRTRTGVLEKSPDGKHQLTVTESPGDPSRPPRGRLVTISTAPTSTREQ
jgi:hypothetical protein